MIARKPSSSTHLSELQRLKRQNRRLLELNKQLESENSLLNQLAGSSEVGMYVKNYEHQFIFVNHAFCQHLQVTREMILNRAPHRLPELVRHYTRDDKKVYKSRNVIFNLIENKERDVWIETVKFPWIDPHQQFKGIYGFTYDISDHVRVEEGLRETRAALKKANLVNEALRQFSYAASHDLREPLRSVQSFLKLIQMEYGEQLDQSANVYFVKADESLNRMHDLIKDILDYAVINGANYDLVTVDLNSVIDEVLKNLNLSIRQLKARITAEPLPAIKGNAGLLNHYFQNMISNSLKYRSPGIQPEIRIFSQSHPKKIIIGIRDNGIGIDPRHFNEIFKPFKRLHRQNEYTGSGIGLATSKKIVQIHGGKLWVESEPGSGATFFMEFPKK